MFYPFLIFSFFVLICFPCLLLCYICLTFLFSLGLLCFSCFKEVRLLDLVYVLLCSLFSRLGLERVCIRMLSACARILRMHTTRLRT